MHLNTSPYSPALSQAAIRPPATLTVAITDNCNLSCCHCLVAENRQLQTGHVAEWSLLQLINQFYSLGGEHIRFTGGEPLLHPAWLRAMQFADTIGLTEITLQTNAVLLTNQHVKQLQRSHLPGFSIQISLDGATASSHDLVRGPGAFAATMQAIDRLIQSGFAGKVTINFTEMRHNLEEFPDLLQLAEKLGLAAVSAGTLIHGGEAAECTKISQPENGQYLRLLDRYDNDQAFRDRYDTFGNMAALQWRKGDSPRSSCCTFAEHPYITADGRLYPCLLCHTDQYAVRGVYKKGLEAALTEGALLWEPLLEISRRRSALIAQCCDCPGADVCAGGCMGRALISCGNPWSADDRCEQRSTIYHTYPLSRDDIE